MNIGSGGVLGFGSFTTATIGGLAGEGDLTLPSGLTLTVGGDGATTTYSGDISGGGGLTVAGPGDLTLSGTLSFDGSLVVSGGTLALSGVNTYGGIENVPGTNHYTFTGNTQLLGGTLSISSFSSISQAPTPWIDGGHLFNLDAGTLLYTGMGNDSFSQFIYSSSPNTGVIDIQNTSANVTIDGSLCRFYEEGGWHADAHWRQQRGHR